MTGHRVFDELTHWEAAKTDGSGNDVAGGWFPNGEKWYIGAGDDAYWNRVLDKARMSYGDPNIHYNTDSRAQDRYLVFGDGIRLPTDGTIVYHDFGQSQQLGPERRRHGVSAEPGRQRRSCDQADRLPPDI